MLRMTGDKIGWSTFRTVHLKLVIKDRWTANRFASSAVKKENTKEKKKTDKRRKADEFAHTLQLPYTCLPFQEKSVDYERPLIDSDLIIKTYERQQQSKDGQQFVLLDGPPYANGNLHIGHAINKILKDIFVRHHFLEGKRCHFRPGWDCHGLPIELKALQQGESFRLQPNEIRDRAKQFALQTMNKQASSFRRWAVMADLRNPYVTCSTDYMINEMRCFQRLFERGLIFKKRLPIYWSPSSRTALAESELEYNEQHQGRSVYVRFELDRQALERQLDIRLEQDCKAYALIWTTTPWTLPANQAVAFSSQMEYCLVVRKGVNEKKKKDQTFLMVGKESISHLQQQFGCDLEIIHTFSGSKLAGLTYGHPLKGVKWFPLIESEFISGGKGTGLVHSAPNHGQDDYAICAAHGITPEPCLVNEKGHFNEHSLAWLPEEALNTPVLDQGSDLVLRLLGDHVEHSSSYVHNYPYDWRTKQPVLTLSTCQFFMDIRPIRQECEQAIDQVNFIPPTFALKLKQNIVQRPQWCISRQRFWGVPIPVFYRQDDVEKLNPILTPALLEQIVRLMESKGPNCWWELSTDHFITNEIIQKDGLPGVADDYVKEKDILDVWFDSGLAFDYVAGRERADLIVEGQDQLRGWFLSSLILGVALNGQAPFRNVFVHGFAVDKDFRKMSKSLGNVFDPEDVVDGQLALGSDVLRLWVASYANSHVNVATREEQFIKCNEWLQKIRKSVRFCLANLNNANRSELESMMLDNNNRQASSIDRYFLHLMHEYDCQTRQAYADYDLAKVMELSQNFLHTLSSLYFASVKDTLYNEPVQSDARKCVQNVLWQAKKVLERHLTPVCPLLFERINQYDPLKNDGDCNSTKTCLSFKSDSRLAEQFERLCFVRNQLHSKLNGESVLIKHMAVIFTSDTKLIQAFNEMRSWTELSNFLQTSSAQFISNEDDFDRLVAANHHNAIVLSPDANTKVLILPSSQGKCKRCRRYVCESKEKDVDHQHLLCSRCHQVLRDHFPHTLNSSM